MRVVQGYPPNFEEIAAVFPEARKKGVIFTYGETIFAPDQRVMSRALLCHEAMHGQRQGSREETIKKWWTSYLLDEGFRFQEELVAHRAEYGWFKGKDRNEAHYMLRQIAKRLASPLYGSMVNEVEARQLISRGK